MGTGVLVGISSELKVLKVRPMDALWKGSLLLVPCPLPLGFLVLCMVWSFRLARRSGPLFLRLLRPPQKNY